MKRKNILVIVLLFSVLIMLSYIWPRGNVHESNELRAIIVDGLADEIPNERLINYTKNTLESLGFKVDVVSGTNVTVETYRSILRGEYDVLIFRVHGGYYGEEDRVLVGLFTSEPYDPNKYRDEQMLRLVAVGRPFINPEKLVFAVSPQFIEAYCRNLDGSIVMVFSCFSLYGDSMAKAFVGKGASVYIGWMGPVDSTLNDEAMEKMVYYLFSTKLSVNDAVSRTIEDCMQTFHDKIPLLYYPSSAGDYNIDNIIKK